MSQLQGLDAALELLEFFTREQPDWGVRELAKASGRHPSVVQRMLSTFAARGLLRQNPASGRYGLGLRLFELGMLLRGQLHLADLIRPVMQQLASASGETVFLCWRQAHEAICLEVVEGPGPVRFSTSAGLRSPLHAAAFTKVILAFQDEDFIANVLAAGLPRLTPHTMVDAAQLRAQLDLVRQQGWAYSEQEAAAGTCGLAVPLALRGGRAQGSLCLSGPLERNAGQRLLEFLPALRAAADQVLQAARPFVEVG